MATTLDKAVKDKALKELPLRPGETTVIAFAIGVTPPRPRCRLLITAGSAAALGAIIGLVPRASAAIVLLAVTAGALVGALVKQLVAPTQRQADPGHKAASRSRVYVLTSDRFLVASASPIGGPDVKVIDDLPLDHIAEVSTVQHSRLGLVYASTLNLRLVNGPDHSYTLPWDLGGLKGRFVDALKSAVQREHSG